MSVWEQVIEEKVIGKIGIREQVIGEQVIGE